MTETSDRNDSKPEQPERDAGASSNPSEPLPLDLLEQWTGDRWTQETPEESKPSRDFFLPPSSTLAAEPKPTKSSPPSKDEADDE